MNTSKVTRRLLLSAVALAASFSDITFTPMPAVGWIPAAQAVVGAPLTPVSGAGVARRTTRRVAATQGAAASSTKQQQEATAQQQSSIAQQQAATAQQQTATAQQQAAVAQQQAAVTKPPTGSIATTLPPGCKAETKDGVEYQKCGEVSYRAAFQGNNLVYVVQ
ncbi:hypothetical protein [Uliginosibacterium aquaticum]|uniref:hypothetical protein n=1 Tax=Uliginosibacterium aquaticum TaxID=2731212 RepID=UPI001C2D2DEA|nr:hypothetical protein [Uliginosibacterium aquaticum]